MRSKFLIIFLCFAAIAAWVPVARGAIFINSFQLSSGPIAPVIESYTYVPNTAGTQSSTLTINKPAGTVAGDLLLVMVARDYGVDPEITSAGWISVNQFNGGSRSVAILRRIADGTEGASFVFGMGTGLGRPVGIMLRISGVDQSAPIADWNITSDDLDVASYVMNPVLSPGPKHLGISFVYWYVAGNAGMGFNIADGEWVEDLELNPHTRYSFGFGHKPELADGVNDGFTVTRNQITGTQRFTGYLLAIAPTSS